LVLGSSSFSGCDPLLRSYWRFGRWGQTRLALVLPDGGGDSVDIEAMCSTHALA
jgi:hypothetical protein